MHIVVGNNPETSQRVSDKYLQINGVGSTLEEKRDLIVNEPNGRCDYGLQYVDRGMIEYDFGSGYEAVSAGTFVLTHPRQPYKMRLKRDFEGNHSWVHFSGTAVESILKELCLYNKIKIEVGVYQRITELYNNIFRELIYCNPGYEQAINSEMLELLLFASRHSSCVRDIKQNEGRIFVGTMWDERITKAMQEIHIHSERFFSVDELAKICNMSKYYFCHVFVESIGTSPHKYMIDMKLEKAEEMLNCSDMSISEISERLGFNDVVKFRRAFRSKYKISPSEYRKNNKSSI